MPVGSYKWTYFSTVSDIDLIESVEIRADSQTELFEILVNMIRQKVRNITLSDPPLYLTDFKGGENPYLREMYWRLQYTIEHPKSPMITLKEAKNIGKEHYDEHRITESEYNFVLSSNNLEEIQKVYRNKFIMRWKSDALVQQNPMKVLLGGDTIRLTDALNQEPIYHKKKQISPPGIPLIKMDVMAFIDGVLMEITNILKIVWINEKRVIPLSIFEHPYAYYLEQEALKYLNKNKYYVKGLKRIWILYANYLADFKLSAKLRTDLHTSKAFIESILDSDLLYLERIAGFFMIAYDMITENKQYPLENIPYGKLLENIFFMTSSLFHEIQNLMEKSPFTSKLTRYCMDTLDNIYNGITIHNTKEGTNRIEINGKERRFRLYIESALTQMRTLLRKVIQNTMEQRIDESVKKKILRDLRKNVQTILTINPTKNV